MKRKPRSPYPIIVLGTSGLAREMAQLIGQINAAYGQMWDVRGFVGEAGVEIGKDLGYGRILGDDEWLLSQTGEYALVVGVGYPSVREKIAAKYTTNPAFIFPNLFHPTAVIGDSVRLGCGNVVTAGCILTCNIAIGNFNLFNWNTTVGHDVVVANNCVFNPAVNMSGNVSVGDCVFVGTGAQVLERLAIGKGASVGAGAVVTKDVPSYATVVGIPAKPLRQ